MTIDQSKKKIHILDIVFAEFAIIMLTMFHIMHQYIPRLTTCMARNLLGKTPDSDKTKSLFNKNQSL